MPVKIKSQDELTGRALNAAESFVSELSFVRRKIVVEQEALREAAGADVDRQEALNRLDSWFAKLCGKEAIAAFAERFSKAKFVEPSEAEALSLAAFAADGPLRATIKAEIERRHDRSAGVTDADRRARLDEHRNRLRALEASEEIIIRRGEDAEMTIIRRPEAVPAIVLAPLEELSKCL